MKKLLILSAALLVFLGAVLGQAKKPSIMVVPSTAWCDQNGYTQTYDNMGVTSIVPDYKTALIKDMNLKLSIAKINELMADRGFPLKDLEATINSIERSIAEESVISSKSSGASLAENPIDRLKRTAKADIIIELSWSVTTTGPKSTLSYIMEAKDSYTNKSVAGSSGVGAPSFSAEVPVLLQEAVLSNIDNFNNRLQNHFDDMFQNGREVALEIRVFDNGSGIDLESEFDGDELSEIIDDWMAANTVNNRYSKLSGSETRLSYEQVRIPLYKTNGSAMDTEDFVRQLRKFLSAEPYKIVSKVLPNGLGSATLIIGEK